MRISGYTVFLEILLYIVTVTRRQVMEVRTPKFQLQSIRAYISVVFLLQISVLIQSRICFDHRPVLNFRAYSSPGK